MTQARDVIDQLTGSAGDARLQALRARRPEVRKQLEASDAAMFELEDASGLTLLDRHAVALRVAVLHGALGPYARHRAALQSLGGGLGEPQLRQIEAGPEAVAPRLAAILAHADLLTLRPRAAQPASLNALRVQGLRERDILALSQLVGWLNFQVRLVAGLQLLRGRAEDAPAGAEEAPESSGHFTLQAVTWRSWLGTGVDAQALRVPTPLSDAILYGSDGLSRAERELTALAVARIDGCSWRASAHARLYVQLARDEGTASRLLAEGSTAALSPRLRALVDYAAALTRTPPAGERALAALRRAGFSELEILDATHVVALSAWASRLALTLGQPVPTD